MLGIVSGADGRFFPAPASGRIRGASTRVRNLKAEHLWTLSALEVETSICRHAHQYSGRTCAFMCFELTVLYYAVLTTQLPAVHAPKTRPLPIPPPDQNLIAGRDAKS